MSLTDIGINLTNKQYRRDRDAVVERALAAGVSRMIVTGTSVEASIEAQQLASQRPGVLWSTAGVHPHDAKQLDAAGVERLRDLCSQPCVVAVGECGLDYNRDFSPRAQQRRAFGWQLQLAADLKLPVFLHQRDAHDDFSAMLAEAAPSLCNMVVHCFTGTPAEAERYLELGAHIGVTGWLCDERRGDSLRQAVVSIPSDRLLIETDGPYLLPRDLEPRPKSRRNEPCYLPHIARAVARCSGRELEQIVAETHQNAGRVFGLDAG